eukprot:6304507-Pyramimonas_sp.AAC.1
MINNASAILARRQHISITINEAALKVHTKSYGFKGRAGAIAPPASPSAAPSSSAPASAAASAPPPDP